MWAPIPAGTVHAACGFAERASTSTPRGRTVASAAIGAALEEEDRMTERIPGDAVEGEYTDSEIPEETGTAGHRGAEEAGEYTDSEIPGETVPGSGAAHIADRDGDGL